MGSHQNTSQPGSISLPKTSTLLKPSVHTTPCSYSNPDSAACAQTSAFFSKPAEDGSRRSLTAGQHADNKRLWSPQLHGTSVSRCLLPEVQGQSRQRRQKNCKTQRWWPSAGKWYLLDIREPLLIRTHSSCDYSTRAVQTTADKDPSMVGEGIMNSHP